MESDVRPHLIVATTAFSPLIGGAEIAVQEIVRQLSTQFRFTIVTPRYTRAVAARDDWYGARVIRVGCGTRFDKWWLIIWLPVLVSRFRAREGAQLVWAIMASYAGAAACLANMLTRMPYVLTLQEGDDLALIEQRVGFALPLFKQIFVRAQGIQAIAPFLSAWAVRMGARCTPVVIPNGVTPIEFQLDGASRTEARANVRAENGIPVDANVVLTISRLVEKNGVADLIDAIAGTEMHLLIVGDGELRTSLEARAEAFRERVHFLGVREQTDIKNYIAAADLFCRPSHSEGFGIVFLEALAGGLPVVATRVGGIPSVLTHGTHGLLVEPHDLVALRAALLLIATDAELRERFRRNGVENVQKFLWDTLAPQIAQWLQSI